ncbi:hypothetical protein ZWY2020_049833 [Hordeum vulgare]|nr:hypothetical protein ZWY2020_049833 [Hordeum vulgare]
MTSTHRAAPPRRSTSKPVQPRSYGHASQDDVSSCHHWYQYTVEEQYQDFNQRQYLCTVRVFPDYPGAEEPIHWSYGLGVTVDMAVQDAAYSMLTIMRARHALLQNTEFCYVPASQPGEEGYLSGVYFDSSMEDPLLQSTAEMLENRDRDARALRMELYATRARL